MRAPAFATGGIIAELTAARDQLDRTIELLERSLDLREQLTFQFDMDDARDLVAEFVRDVDQHMRRP